MDIRDFENIRDYIIDPMLHKIQGIIANLCRHHLNEGLGCELCPFCINEKCYTRYINKITRLSP